MAEATDNRLRLLVERIERLVEERRGITADIRDVYAEAKAVGYDAKVLAQVVKRRAMNADDRAEQDLILETYETALGVALKMDSAAGKKPSARVRNLSNARAAADMARRALNGEI